MNVSAVESGSNFEKWPGSLKRHTKGFGSVPAPESPPIPKLPLADAGESLTGVTHREPKPLFQ